MSRSHGGDDIVQTLPPLGLLRQPSALVPPSNRKLHQLRFGREGDVEKGRGQSHEIGMYTGDAQEQRRENCNCDCGPPREAVESCGLSAVAAAFGIFGGPISVAAAPAAAVRLNAREKLCEGLEPATQVWLPPMRAPPSSGRGAGRLTSEAACRVKDRKEQFRGVSDMIFGYLDRDNDGLLSREEMSRLAIITTGNEPAYEEWLDLCADLGAMRERGLSKDHFFEIVLRIPDEQSLDDLLRMVRAAHQDQRLCSSRSAGLDPATLRPNVQAFGEAGMTPSAGHLDFAYG